MNEELYNHNLTGQIIPPNLPEPWVRNPEWLEMPVVDPTEKKIVILQRINPGTHNYFGFSMSVTGGYTVDWGDGTSDTYASNASSGKIYDYDLITGTPTSEGFKQVLITITPVLNSVPTAVDFQRKSAAMTGSSVYSNGALDIIISLPGGPSSIALGSSSTLPYNYPYVERVQIIASALTSYAYIFGDMISLKSASVSSSASVTNLSQMFWNCNSIQLAPTLPWSTATNCTGVFERCYLLKSVGIDVITTPSTQLASVFSYCRNLVTVPKFVVTAASANANYMFYLCSNLRSVPDISWEKLNSTTQMFQGCASLLKVGDLNLPLSTNTSGMFGACYGVTEIGSVNAPVSTNMSSMFSYCHSVRKIGPITSGPALTVMSTMFNYCYALRELPTISNTTNVVNMSNLASYCTSITAPHNYNTSKVTNIANMYSYCDSLASFPDYDFSSVVTASNVVDNCPSLDTIGALYFGGTGAVSLGSFMQGNNAFASAISQIGPITFGPNVTTTNLSSFAGNGRFLQQIDIDCSKVSSTAQISSFLAGAGSIKSVILNGLRYGTFTIIGSLSRDALIALFTSLGTAAGAQTITVSGNWGWASLTADDKLIATSKGWTLA